MIVKDFDKKMIYNFSLMINQHIDFVYKIQFSIV